MSVSKHRETRKRILLVSASRRIAMGETSIVENGRTRTRVARAPVWRVTIARATIVANPATYVRAQCRLHVRHDEEGAEAHVVEMQEGNLTVSRDVLGDDHWGMMAEAKPRTSMTNSPKQFAGDWVVDSGCSIHMTGDGSIFLTFNEQDGRVTIANGQHLKSNGHGAVELLVHNGDDGLPARLKVDRVLYVSELKKNPMSVAQGTKEGMKFKFDIVGKLHIRKGNLHLTTMSRTCTGLYVINHLRAKDNENDFAYIVSHRLSLDLRHKRRRHASHDIVMQLSNNDKVKGLRLHPHVNNERQACDACELGRNKRSVFRPASRDKIKQCHAVVHSDICGPLEVAALDGSMYVLLFVDAYLRFCHVRFIKQRLELLHEFSQHHLMIENQHNLPLTLSSATTAASTRPTCSSNCVPNGEYNEERLSRTRQNKTGSRTFVSGSGSERRAPW